MTQQFTITDIRRTQVGDTRVASVTLTPPKPDEPLAAPVPYGIGAMNPSPLHITGIPAADVLGWDVGDTIILTATKSL